MQAQFANRVCLLQYLYFKISTIAQLFLLLGVALYSVIVLPKDNRICILLHSVYVYVFPTQNILKPVCFFVCVYPAFTDMLREQTRGLQMQVKLLLKQPIKFKKHSSHNVEGTAVFY